MLFKIKNILVETIKYYFLYFYVVIGFGINLFFVFLTLTNNSFSIYSGDLTYLFLGKFSEAILTVITIIFVSFIFSFFNTVLIFLIRKDLQQGYDKTHILDVLKTRLWEMFYFNLSINLLLLILYIITSLLHIFVIMPFLYIIILFPLLFVNQAIMIDELGIKKAIKLSLFFIKKNKVKTLIIIIIVPLLIIFILTLISYYFNGGYLLSLLLINIFLVPFTEILKTVIYMTKFKIIDSYF